MGFAVIVLIHGALHLIGATSEWGWAWIAAAVLVVAAGVLVLWRVDWSWIVLGVAAVGSEAVIATSWSDARAGTAGNAIMLLAAGYGFVARGPRSLHAQYRRLAAAANARSAAAPPDVVTEADLEGLPAPLAAYLRTCGVVGKPRVTSFRATIHGRVRGGPDEPWMRFTGEQVNTFGERPERFFLIDATRRGLPIDVLHAFTDHATMRARLCAAVPIVDGSGPEMDRAETVTLFNDMCLLAPAALLDADVTWQEVDDRLVKGTFRRGTQEVSADLVFDFDHRLVDFESDDRFRSSSDGHTFTRTRWSTPVQEYADFDGRRLVSRGDAVWHPGPPVGQFAYLEFVVDAISYDHGQLMTPDLRMSA
jgi:hypothetical protein